MTNPDPAELSKLEDIFAQFLNLAITISGLAAFTMLIVGGFKYLTSAGDPKQVQSATSTITMAVVGLIVAIGAWFLLNFIANFTNTSDTLFNFKIFQ